MEERDLFLHYEKTDDRGRRQYGIYPASDGKTLRYRMGEVRLEPEDFSEVRDVS